MFQTFEISELADESENDYAVEIQASSCKFGVLLTEDELEAMGQAMLETAREDNFESYDGKTVDDFVTTENGRDPAEGGSR